MNLKKKRLKTFVNVSHKYLIFTELLLFVFGTVKLFTFSTHESELDNTFRNSFNESYQIFALNVPEETEFAGEKVPLTRFDIKESFDQELLVNTYWQSNTLLSIKRANRWFPVIESILKKHNVPDDFKYLALIESGFKNVVSPSGAAGYWQFLKTSGKEYGLEITNEVDERYNVEKATEAACRYLTNAKNKLGSWTLAAASYNAGIDGIDIQIQKQHVNSYYDLMLNDETARYVFRIIAAKEIIKNPTKYGFQFRQKDLYYTVPYNEIEVDSTINDLAVFAVQNNSSYKLLKLLNPWLRENHLLHKPGKTYKIQFPKESFNPLELEDFKNSTSSQDSI